MELSKKEIQVYNTLLGLVDTNGIVTGVRSYELAELADLDFKGGNRNDVSSRVSQIIRKLERKKLVKRIPGLDNKKFTDYVIMARCKGDFPKDEPDIIEEGKPMTKEEKVVRPEPRQGNEAPKEEAPSGILQLREVANLIQKDNEISRIDVIEHDVQRHEKYLQMIVKALQKL